MPTTKEELMRELNMKPAEFKSHCAARGVQMQDIFSDEDVAKIKSIVRATRPVKGGAVAPPVPSNPPTDDTAQIANLVPMRAQQTQLAIKTGVGLANEKWTTVASSYAKRDSQLAQGFAELIARPFADMNAELEIDEDEEPVAPQDFFSHLYGGSSTEIISDSEPPLSIESSAA